MTLSTSRRVTVAVLVLLGAVGTGAFGGAGSLAGAAPVPRPSFDVTERAVVPAARYWTRARMAAASRASGASAVSEVSGVSGVPWARDGAVARTTGRVFFTLDNVAYACSGSAVASQNQDVVLTAAHCVSDGAGHWATHWTFVPGYTNGREPYGSYPAQTYYVPAQWSAGADEDDDVAFVAVGPALAGTVLAGTVLASRGRGHKLGEAVGGQPIEFGWRAPDAAVFGYPSEPPYTGQGLDYCEGTLRSDPFGTQDEGITCAMTEGGSGGPWLSDFDPRTGLGVITGVTTFRYVGQDRMLYSAGLGPVAQALYERASAL
ncbi:MAG: trypsin-like serine peptidase [Streptosporangiaceae bacterium]